MPCLGNNHYLCTLLLVLHLLKPPVWTMMRVAVPQLLLPATRTNQGSRRQWGERKLCMHPKQPRGRTFPKKKFGQVSPEYRAFKESWFDNQNWSKWLHWEEERRGFIALFAEMCMCWASLRYLKTRSLPLSQLASTTGKMQ